jgi:pimeloyl-ACP methyl ester carboxylesterase
MEPTSTQGHIELINDIEMYYEVRGDGEPLLLLHGGGGIGANWDLIFEAPPAGYRLIIPDLRGHGRSTNPAPGFTFRQLAHALIVHGDRDPLYPVHLAMEMYSAIPRSSLWIVPNGGHGPIFGEMAGSFAETALAFLRGAWSGK